MGSSRLLSSDRFAIVAALGTLLTGCAAPPPPPPPAPVVNEWDSDRPPHLIPSTAVRVAEGTPPLSYIPSAAATVYILDNDSHSLVNTSEVTSHSTGSFFMIDASEKALVLKNAQEPSQRIVLAAPIDISHRFSIWVVRPSSTTQP